jgi:aminoglycoside/choline kinase family phosphotransferase
LIKGSLWHPALEDIYRRRFGREIYSCSVLSSHGSDRIILRLRSDGNSAIGIINKNPKENKAFIEFSKHFRKFNLRVPEIYGASVDETSYVTEDLGDVTLFSIIDSDGFRAGTVALYEAVIRELTRFQAEAGPSIDFSLCYQFNEFGEDNIDCDLKYFKEKFLDNYHREYDESKLGEDFTRLKQKLLECPRDYFLYRDFQSRNVMLKNGHPHFIDYQSGRRGALQYDVASLLYDARADMPQEIREKLLDYYIEQVKAFAAIDAEQFKKYFWYFGVVRILQALGAYGYLGLGKRKKKFLESIPFALKNISFILNNRIKAGELNYLRVILNDSVTRNGVSSAETPFRLTDCKNTKEHERKKNQRA